MDQHPRHIVAVMGVVTDAADRLLLVKSPQRGWEPPGGQVERGEDLITALEREIAEESGCTVSVGRLVAIYSNVGPLGILMFTFLCAHVAGDPTGGAECEDAGWFTRDEALQLVTHPAQAQKLRDALDAPTNPGVLYGVYATTPELDASGLLRYTRYEARRTHLC